MGCVRVEGIGFRGFRVEGVEGIGFRGKVALCKVYRVQGLFLWVLWGSYKRRTRRGLWLSGSMKA